MNEHERAVEQSVEAIADDVVKELQRAMQKFPKFHSAHEGYAILKEEIEEAWDAIKKNDLDHARVEMIQVAAMAIRFIHDLTPTGQCRKEV
jgi:hypothetical protein